MAWFEYEQPVTLLQVFVVKTNYYPTDSLTNGVIGRTRSFPQARGLTKKTKTFTLYRSLCTQLSYRLQCSIKNTRKHTKKTGRHWGGCLGDTLQNVDCGHGKNIRKPQRVSQPPKPSRTQPTQPQKNEIQS